MVTRPRWFAWKNGDPRSRNGLKWNSSRKGEINFGGQASGITDTAGFDECQIIEGEGCQKPVCNPSSSHLHARCQCMLHQSRSRETMAGYSRDWTSQKLGKKQGLLTRHRICLGLANYLEKFHFASYASHLEWVQNVETDIVVPDIRESCRCWVCFITGQWDNMVVRRGIGVMWRSRWVTSHALFLLHH